MTTDKILEIGIDEKERLYIKPKNERFTMIYRAAAEVHWESNGQYLYSPKPREWTYLDWFMHIIDVVRSEYGCRLLLTPQTSWTNVPNDLRQQITKTYQPNDRY
jgi:hypothetical protein